MLPLIGRVSDSTAANPWLFSLVLVVLCSGCSPKTVRVSADLEVARHTVSELLAGVPKFAVPHACRIVAPVESSPFPPPLDHKWYIRTDLQAISDDTLTLIQEYVGRENVEHASCKIEVHAFIAMYDVSTGVDSGLVDLAGVASVEEFLGHAHMVRPFKVRGRGDGHFFIAMNDEKTAQTAKQAVYKAVVSMFLRVFQTTRAE